MLLQEEAFTDSKQGAAGVQDNDVSAVQSQEVLSTGEAAFAELGVEEAEGKIQQDGQKGVVPWP